MADQSSSAMPSSAAFAIGDPAAPGGPGGAHDAPGARDTQHDVVGLAGGEFRMGSDRHYPEEAPVHRVRVDAFGIDRYPVTNAQFAAFVAATGYLTVAERPLEPADFPGAPAENLQPGSLVFVPTPGPVDLRHLSQWWAWTPGASWRDPEGRAVRLTGRAAAVDDEPPVLADRAEHPVVHVAHGDAAAYAAWVGGRLPSEAEWEFAARGGLDGTDFTWGDERRPSGRLMANTWDGLDFPWRSTGESGYLRTSPVGAFPANGFGLFDMAGNVWEWTDDWWSADHSVAGVAEESGGRPGEEASCCAPSWSRDDPRDTPRGSQRENPRDNPRGGTVADSYDPAQPQFRIPRKVIKGGSHLCADTYCLRYRPAARRPQMIDTGMSHVGFRCAWDPSITDMPSTEIGR